MTFLHRCFVPNALDTPETPLGERTVPVVVNSQDLHRSSEYIGLEPESATIRQIGDVWCWIIPLEPTAGIASGTFSICLQRDNKPF